MGNFSSLVVSLFFVAKVFFLPVLAQSSTTLDPATLEKRIQRAVSRMLYLQDSEVVKRGLQDLEKLLTTQPGLDISWRADVRQALIGVVQADPKTYALVNPTAKRKAGDLIGRTKILNALSSELIEVLKSSTPIYAENAIREFIKVTKSPPNQDLLNALEELKNWSLLQEVAIETKNDPTIRILITHATMAARYDFLYGIDQLEAANLVAKHATDQFTNPSAPTDLAIKLIASNAIELSWKDNSLGEEGFAVDRAQGDQAFAVLALLPSNQIYFQDKNLKEGESYKYRIRSYNLTKQDGISNEVSMTIPAVEPPPSTEQPSESQESPSSDTSPSEPSSSEAPAPQPPSPQEIPALPISPEPAISFDRLLPKMKIIIEGQPHSASIEAIISVVKLMATPLAFSAGQVLTGQFTKEVFDSDPKATSLGLKAILDLKSRGERELNNMEYLDANIRRSNSDRLKKNASDLEKRFSDD